MKTILPLTLLFSLSLSTTSIFAANGTITFTGSVTDKSCDITTAKGKDFTVALPPVSKTTLKANGDIAGRTQFVIQLANCTPAKVATYFEPGPTVDAATGRLNNQLTTNAAANVQIQLLGSNFGFIPVISGTQPNSQWVDVIQNGGALLNYYAEYYAIGASTAGQVSTSVQYTIIYQ